MKINWREVFKFLSGATFVGTLANLYLAVNNISVPVLGYTMTPELLGWRSVVSFVLFLFFLPFLLLRLCEEVGRRDRRDWLMLGVDSELCRRLGNGGGPDLKGLRPRRQGPERQFLERRLAGRPE
jgi:hypothetical protein